MRQPLIDLKAQYESIKGEIDTAVLKVMSSGDYILGEDVWEFEKEFSAYCGRAYGIGVASGTDALIIALESLNIGEGDEVITTAMSFFATTEAIMRVGATPVFVDIGGDSNIYASKIEEKITDKTRAILPVHHLGNRYAVEQIDQIANSYNLDVIADCAQAGGLKNRGHAKVECYSFFPGKNLGCMGDGGMIVTSNLDILDRARILRKHGARARFHHREVGYNSRLDTIQAAILRVKLKYLDEWNEQRIEIAKIYNKHFHGVLAVETCCNYYCIYHPDRDALADYLEKKGIGTNKYYPYPLHMVPATKKLGYKKGDFPRAEFHAKNVLALPMYPELIVEQQDYIIESIKEFNEKI